MDESSLISNKIISKLLRFPRSIIITNIFVIITKYKKWPQKNYMGRHPTKVDSISPSVRRTTHTERFSAVPSCVESGSGICCLEIRPLPPEVLEALCSRTKQGQLRQ